MTTGLARPEKEGFLLVEFRYGDKNIPQYARYTDWGQSTAGYSSVQMEVEVPENTGLFGDKEARIVINTDSFSTAAAGGLPFSPMFVKVTEITAGLFPGDASHQLVTFIGRVTNTIKNFQGVNNSVAFFAKSIKSRLDVPMGLQCNPTCDWGLFRGACGLGLSEVSHAINGQIASMDGQEITCSPNGGLTSPSSPGGNVDRYWERGYIEKDGIQIGIRLWVLTDPTVFGLRRRPPADWLLAGGSSIKFVPGCHKTPGDCIAVWDNEENFLALGIGMVDYNPLFENPF